MHLATVRIKKLFSTQYSITLRRYFQTLKIKIKKFIY